ncbi:MAG TPA: aspartyl protease family protein [Thermoplasmata archaeon]|nr:aspartyl protease family protein [Thermoplasmata archaeon]
MSVFQVRVAFGPLDRSRWVEVDVVVDTGATLTKIPRSLAEDLGLAPEGTVTVRLGDGHLIERVVASAVIRCEGRQRIIPLSLGEESEPAVLGATALEILSLSPDPVNEVLVPTVAYELLAVAG